jgi:thermopsin
MRWMLLVGLGLLTVLALVVHAQAVVSPPTSGYYCNYHIDLNGSGFIVVVSGDHGTYNIAVFTQQNFNAWWYQKQAVPSIYYGTVSYGTVLAIPVPAGDYVVSIYPTSPTSCPIIGIGGKEYLPIGIASYPLTPVTTSELMGFFNITAMSAYNPSGESQFGVPNSGASLQFNAVLVVELINGQKQYYWVQDLLQFITNEMQVRAVNSITNLTSTPSTLLNQTIHGNGNVYISGQNYYYFYSTSFGSYSPPFAGYLIMRAYASGGVAHVDFGYVVIQNGSHHPPSVVWFDNITIIPYEQVSNAYFVVSTNLIGTSTAYYGEDAELVLVGYAGGEWTQFSGLFADLAMVYWNGSAWVPLPRLFDFGIDTAEGAVPNISVSVSSNGFATVSLGSFSPGLVAGEVPTPALPMTCVSYSNPVANQYFSGYITQPMTINFPGTVYVSSNERYVFQGYFVNNEFLTNSSITITPSETWFAQYDIEPVYQLQYLVSIVSPLPIYVNGEETVNYTNWLSLGSQVGIVALDYVLPNGTMFIPGVGNETLTVNAPTTLVIAWSPRYLVTVTSTMPIYVNGQLVSNYTAWLSPGTTLTIRAPTYSAYGGLVLYQPNTTTLTLTISKPTKLTITYTPNYDRLYIAIGAAVTTIVLVTVIPMSRRKQRRH